MTRNNIDDESLIVSEHMAGFHDEVIKGCPECYKENRMILAKKTVTHQDMLNKHPGLRNPHGDNYPLGYNPND